MSRKGSSPRSEGRAVRDVSPTRPGLVVHTHADARVLADGFRVEACRPGDPFQRPLVVIPGTGMGRWLGQTVAQGAGSEGVYAGFDVHPLRGLESLLQAGHQADDPWEPDHLVWSILHLIDTEPDTSLALLRTHLAATDQRFANALRLARLFTHYANYRPELLSSWMTDAVESPSEATGAVDAWQPALWRRLHQAIDEPDPVERRARLTDALQRGDILTPWPEIHVFAPRFVRPFDTVLLQALASQRPVHVWLPVSGPQTTSHPVGQPLGRRGRAWRRAWDAVADRIDPLPTVASPITTLGHLQAGILSGRPASEDPPEPDHTIAIHASHGTARQVGVLREALAAAFADDPTLEPRHVVVACPDPAVLAPHLGASFTPLTGGGSASRGHPATQLRLQIAEASAADTNQVYRVVTDLLGLGASRATTNDLLALATHPHVARRFGFDPEDSDRLEELLDQAGVRWGINQAHRQRFGLGEIAQSTWQLGVQRLIMGEAFSRDQLATAGIVSTVDDVSSTDADLIGSLAEFVSRVSRVVAAIQEEATLATWVERLRSALDLLVDVRFEDLWQLNQVWATLDDLDSSETASPSVLGVADVAALLASSFGARSTRPHYGNGSLVVCSLEALARVPHRVVCLVGLDERTFPRRSPLDGDDLLLRAPQATDPDLGADDRQRILDAVLSATERLIIVYQGHSAHTRAEHHPPAGVLEIVEAVGRVRHESLQPFAAMNFTGASPRSFDVAALTAARALAGDPQPAPDRWEVGFLPTGTQLTTVDVATLISLLQHPARYWLRQRTGLTLADDAPANEALPLDLGPLDEWAIGHRLLTALTEGQPSDRLVVSEWLSGDIPPQALGQRAMDRVSATAKKIHERWREVADGPVTSDLASFDVNGVRVTGATLTRGGRIVEAHYARISPRHLAAAWVRVLVTTVATGNRTDAILVGRAGHERLSAPPPKIAQGILAALVDLAGDGLQEVLPLPPRVGHRWAQDRARGRDPLADSRGLVEAWKRDKDNVWGRYFPVRKPWERARTDEGRWGHPEESTSVGALAWIVWEPLVRGQGA